MGKICKNLRKQWSQNQLEDALQAIRAGESQRNVCARFKLPRRTLRRYIDQGLSVKRLGRPSILSQEQEREFVQRIKRYSQIGLPLTPKLVRHQMYRFCERNNIPNNFNEQTQVAGKDWLSLFLKRNPDLSTRRAQLMNPARAQKLNRTIVSDYFAKLNTIMTTLDIKDKPQNVYNMDEKGCRLTIHHQQRILSEKGVKRVHMVAPEHAENVTVVACCNAMGNSIPPMILFKGKRLKPEFTDNLPLGSLVKMAPKGSMTTELFNVFLRHFAKYKSTGSNLLVFDGASSHLDFSIAETADSLGITIFCLPSNTTHELQPLDKAVFRSFEANWDQELLRYWDTHPQRTLNKARFNIIFSRVWPKCMAPENILSGFRSTGMFPLNPEAIPDAAFAPSLVTERAMPNEQNENQKETRDEAGPSLASDSSDDADNENIPLATLRSKVKRAPQESSPDKLNESFKEMLPTPVEKNKIVTAVRRKAINYKAQHVTRDLFHSGSASSSSKHLAPFTSAAVPSTSKQESIIGDCLRKCEGTTGAPAIQKLILSRPNSIRKQSPTSKQQSDIPKSAFKQTDQDSWYCVACNEIKQLDMRMCRKCHTWYHEECVGLEADDYDDFECC